MKYLPLLIAGALAFSGCAGHQAYKTLASVGYTTDTAATTYFNGVVRGVIPTNGVPAVSQAYNTFQVTYHTAIVFAKGNTNMPAGTDVLMQSANVINTINANK